jgi:hypothetical protein
MRTILGGLLAASVLLAAQATQAQTIITLQTGFTPDPHQEGVVAGGSVDLSALDDDCAGYVADRADFLLNYTAGTTLGLDIYMRAATDTVLVVQDPEGQFWCDDDSGGDNNPYLGWSDPISGTYRIWAGTYASGAYVDATLLISEVAGHD